MNVFPVSPGSNPTNLAYFSEINEIDSKDKNMMKSLIDSYLHLP